MSQYDQRRLYQELDGVTNSGDFTPDAKENCDFWIGIWYNPAEHNQEAEWLADVEESLKDEKGTRECGHYYGRCSKPKEEGCQLEKTGARWSSRILTEVLP